MKRFCFPFLFFCLLVSAESNERSPIGFFPSRVQQQQEYEAKFLQVPTPQMEQKWLRWLTEEPRVAGTPADRESAEYVRDRLREFGIAADLAEYEVYLNYPKHVSLKLIHPVSEELSLREEGVTKDKDSFSTKAYPGFHGYGASGKVAGEVVYVNYGTRDDFNKLEELGISVKGRIAIARYGNIYRGLKVREAQQRGATGIIIFSDPADDGYMKGDVYPNGPMRPASAIQRGAVHFNSEGAGDPTTPGWPSKKGAKRIDLTQARIPKIPSLPLSYGEAEKILRALAGQKVPEGWQGGLPFAYHIGPGPAEVEMDVQMDYAYRPIWNVIGTIPGSEEKDHWVILGNHRDAWVYGAVDPNSGTAAFLETARGLGQAVKAGWKPKRTIVLASWDAEEYGLVGSTEWAEDHARELGTSAVAYINLDSAVPKPDLDIRGTPSLRDLMIEVLKAVPEPVTGKTIFDSWQKAKLKNWATDLTQTRERELYIKFDTAGSGSDFAPFIHHLGIATIDFSFNGPYGVYHSVYDSIYWMENFGDPEYLYHQAASRIFGLLAMRLAAADIVPFRYTPYFHHLQVELDGLQTEAKKIERTFLAGENRQSKSPVQTDFSELEASLKNFGSAAAGLDRQTSSLNSLESVKLAQLNQALIQIEREFLDPDGLPGRGWFKHLLFAPGVTTGYGAWPYPGINQAIRDRNQTLFDSEMKRIVERINAATEKLQQATALTQ